MKKIKFLGTAILAASLLFAGCSSPVEDVVAEEDTSVTLSPEETGSSSGTTNGGSSTGGNSNGGSTGGNNGSGGSSTGGNEVTTGFTVSFSDTNNTVTSADEVYTVNLTNEHGAGDEWGNQIFIKNPNKKAGVKKGDVVKATVTVTADKDITTFFFKNQYNGGNYTGTDTSITLPANTETAVEVVGVVTDDYDDSSSYVIAIRGNEANTTLTIKNIESTVLNGYEVTSVTLAAAPASISSGEESTLTLKDQYGIAIANATFVITSDSVSSTLSGNTLTAGDTTESVVVKAIYGDFEKTITIEVSAEKNYAKYWNLETTATGETAAPNDYFSIWADQNWCGSKVTLSDMGATATGVTLTQTVEGSNWFGTQIWYGLSQTSNLSFKVTSTVAGDISINIGEGNVVYALEAGVEKEFSFENVTGKLAIRLGAEAANTWLGDCTFTISDFSVTPASAAE